MKKRKIMRKLRRIQRQQHGILRREAEVMSAVITLLERDYEDDDDPIGYECISEPRKPSLKVVGDG